MASLWKARNSLMWWWLADARSRSVSSVTWKILDLISFSSLKSLYRHKCRLWSSMPPSNWVVYIIFVDGRVASLWKARNSRNSLIFVGGGLLTLGDGVCSSVTWKFLDLRSRRINRGSCHRHPFGEAGGSIEALGLVCSTVVHSQLKFTCLNSHLFFFSGRESLPENIMWFLVTGYLYFLPLPVLIALGSFSLTCVPIFLIH